jgi:2-oxoglutarate ferredoxin oxidoreductase subunit alpha
MTPVMLLTDGYIANAAEPWKVPDVSSYAPFPVTYLETVPEGGFEPYARNAELKRPWVKPGTPGLLHRIGGIEKKEGTGNIDYSPENHQAMTDIRKAKIDNIAVPDQAVELGTEGGKLVIVGWGSTFGPIHQAVRRARNRGLDVSHVHIRHIWPMPQNLGALLKSYDQILVPEMNTGQLKTVLRDQFLVDAKPLNKVSGQPFQIAEIEAAIEAAFAGHAGGTVQPNASQLPEPFSGHDDGHNKTDPETTGPATLSPQSAA